jgi:hypothetical protein
MNKESKKIEEAIEYADAKVAQRMGDSRWTETDGTEHYTDRAQDLFNKYYDSFQRLII